MLARSESGGETVASTESTKGTTTLVACTSDTHRNGPPRREAYSNCPEIDALLSYWPDCIHFAALHGPRARRSRKSSRLLSLSLDTDLI